MNIELIKHALESGCYLIGNEIQYIFDEDLLKEYENCLKELENALQEIESKKA